MNKFTKNRNKEKMTYDKFKDNMSINVVRNAIQNEINNNEDEYLHRLIESLNKNIEEGGDEEDEYYDKNRNIVKYKYSQLIDGITERDETVLLIARNMITQIVTLDWMEQSGVDIDKVRDVLKI